MREILFRGKRIDNGEWIEGWVVKTTAKNTCIVTNVEELGCGNCIEMFPSRGNFEVDPSTVGQYTGLTDKNGKKIFEGDIVEVLQSVHSMNAKELVEYCGGGFAPFAIPGWECTPDPDWVAVVGNIHDNPELLEGAENE